MDNSLTILEQLKTQHQQERDSQSHLLSLSARNVSVLFENYHYGCRHVNLEVPKHSITSIIGPSGCGKSTFLRAINRLHDSNPLAKVTGQVLVDDEDVLSPKADPVMVRRKIGLILQRPNPFPHLSIFDNVASGLKLVGIRKKSILKEQVELALRRAFVWEELKDRLKYGAVALSGGQQQRLCIARSLAVEPEILLMDEPTSSLDPVATKSIEDLLEQLKSQITVLIVTHSMNQAARISDWTAVFMDGGVLEFGPTDKIFTDPEHPVTMNYISGRIE